MKLTQYWYQNLEDEDMSDWFELETEYALFREPECEYCTNDECCEDCDWTLPIIGDKLGSNHPIIDNIWYQDIKDYILINSLHKPRDGPVDYTDLTKDNQIGYVVQPTPGSELVYCQAAICIILNHDPNAQIYFTIDNDRVIVNQKLLDNVAKYTDLCLDNQTKSARNV